jgi:hypothetical protein
LLLVIARSSAVALQIHQSNRAPPQSSGAEALPLRGSPEYHGAGSGQARFTLTAPIERSGSGHPAIRASSRRFLAVRLEFIGDAVRSVSQAPR